MNRLKANSSELLGLFVDDGRFASAIVIWLIVCGAGLPHLSLPPAWSSAILFLGLAVLLGSSAIRRAGKRP